MAQTTWSDTPAVAFAGLIADLTNSEIGSYVNEEATDMPFGVGVVQGTNDNDMLYPSAANAGNSFLGVTVHSHAYENRSLATTAAIESDAVASVLRRGYIYVLLEEAVVPMDPVFCRFSTGTGTQLGAFGKSSDSGTCFRVEGAKYMTTGAAAGYAVAYIPNVQKSVLVDPTVIETFDEGLSKGLAILTTDGAAYSATAGTLNVMHLSDGNKLGMIPIVGQTIAPAMSANGLDIQCDQVDNDGLEILSGILGLSGRPFIIGRDPAFYFKCQFQIAAVNGTDEFHVGFRRAEALNATWDNYLDTAALGCNTAASPMAIKIETILNNGATTSTDTTDTLASATSVEFGIFVSAAGVVTYTIDGEAPTATAAFTFDDGDPVIPYIHYLQANAAQTGAFDIEHWEVGYQ